MTTEEFLALQRTLAADSNISMLDQLYNELVLMAQSDPDRAASIVDALAGSSETADREIAAIYVGVLFVTNPHQARELLVMLIGDTDCDVRRQALDTLDALTSDSYLSATQAARLATSRPLDTPGQVFGSPTGA